MYARLFLTIFDFREVAKAWGTATLGRIFDHARARRLTRVASLAAWRPFGPQGRFTHLLFCTTGFVVHSECRATFWFCLVSTLLGFWAAHATMFWFHQHFSCPILLGALIFTLLVTFTPLLPVGHYAIDGARFVWTLLLLEAPCTIVWFDMPVPNFLARKLTWACGTCFGTVAP